MRCISEELIQKYIDNEASAREIDLVQSHISSCESCAEKVEKRRYAAGRVKGLLSSLNKNEEVQTPLFREPDLQSSSSRLSTKRLIYLAAAACLLIAFIVFHQKPKEELEYIYLYNVENEYNANLPLSEQEMVIEIIDSKGKLIKD